MTSFEWTRRPITRSKPGSLGVHAHAFDRADASWGEPVAADLLAREAGLVDGGDVDAVAGEVIGRRRTTWAGADDQDVGLDPLGHARLPSGAPSGARETFHKQPSTGSGERAAGIHPGHPWSQASTTAGTTRRNPSCGIAGREPFEAVAREERPVLLVPGGHRLPEVGVLGGQELGHALDPHAREVVPLPPAVDQERDPAVVLEGLPRGVTDPRGDVEGVRLPHEPTGGDVRARRGAAPSPPGTSDGRGTDGGASRGPRSHRHHVREVGRAPRSTRP